MKNFLRTIVSLAVFAFIAVFTLYFYSFDGAFSSDQNIWGVFGDFVGGTLNPILSFLALIALLVTVNLQSQELSETRKELSRTAVANEKQIEYLISQQKREDLFKLVSKLVDRINNNYNKNLLDDGHSIHAALIGADNCMVNDVLFSLMNKMESPESRTYKVVKYLESDLINLSKLLDEYEKHAFEENQTTHVVDFYKSEYRELVTRFIELGWFVPEVGEFYK
ncbi:hypothetical protein SO574_05775 [Vibrio alfacsensis]|uniref:hypothetical protein n=1 Tax=Vibrio alfacsensis TaxID=1074311 RepID=UPI002ADDF9C0|nr:hypothetical protein [Vibrio alfacsensis]WQE77286.1 hypothetical protein SO574_05775 [Vibrio alfacsensis]